MMPLKQLHCVRCGIQLPWEPETLKDDQPGYALRCAAPTCTAYRKIQGVIALATLLQLGVVQSTNR